MKIHWPFIFLFLIAFVDLNSQDAEPEESSLDELYSGLKFRNIGPFRGGRSVAGSGVVGNPQLYYMGSTGGGIWKTTDAGISWKNISDGQLNTGSVGSIEVSLSDPNVIYVGMGEHAVRGVMTSHGDGMYKSVDAGETWTHLGLDQSRHIAEIRIHPNDPDVVFVAVQGAVHGDSEERGVYKTTDGGDTWNKILYVDERTGAADLSMDPSNPNILYAAMWDHRRLPWQVISGGPGSGMYKSKDGGETWEKLEDGLPEALGKTAIDVSPANPNVVYANIEAEGTKGGVYRSNDGGETWSQTTSDRITVARAWYYIEIFADPQDEDQVYVLNAPMLKSIDGGKSFKSISNPHGDQHHMWINPDNPENILLLNDGGACVTFNGGDTWSSQRNQPTIQFYRVITDNQFPYRVYGGQQDNSSVITKSRTGGAGITWKDWRSGPGCESAFLAFDPNNPVDVYGGCYQGNISLLNLNTGKSRDIMAYPIAGLGWLPSEMKYRFNWNAPIVASPQDPSVIYHAGNHVLKTTNGGLTWQEISPDLTKNNKERQPKGGAPYTSEGAGGEVYNTIAYLEASQHSQDVLWAGSDCGLVHVTTNGGSTWLDVTPPNLGDALINCIDVSPHNPEAAYVVATHYKFNDFRPLVYYTDNMGRSWKKITNGISEEHYVRVVREDLKVAGLLYAGTESGMYLSYDNGENWHEFQLNLPIVPITDMTFQDNDLVLATSGRSFWILDDLGSIQQGVGQLNDEAMLFEPKTSIRFRGGGRFRPGATFGQNPASGVTFDYYLPESMDSSEIKVEIMAADGELIRSYSSEKDKAFKRYTGGPSPEATLSTEKGVNRFSWDMRRESIPGVQNIFVLGGYNGATVAPGTYTLRMSIGDEQWTTEARLDPDPRMTARQAEYDQQALVLKRLEEVVVDIHESVNEMREVKSQLMAAEKVIKAVDKEHLLLTVIDSIADKMQSWEGNLIQEDQKTFQDVINFPNKLNAEFINLMGRIDAHSPNVSKGALDRMDDLMREWNSLKSQMEDIVDNDLPSFNAQFKESDLDMVVYPKRD